MNNPAPKPDSRGLAAVKRVMTAIDKVLAAADELRRADAALSLHAARPNLQIVPDDEEGGQDDE
jgi:hypothetical protein